MSTSSSSSSLTPQFTPYVHAPSHKALTPTSFDWNSVLTSDDVDFRPDRRVQAVCSVVRADGAKSTALHYGGGWVISTSHAFPSPQSLQNAVFTFEHPSNTQFTVTKITPYFLVRAGSVVDRDFPDLLFICFGDISQVGVTYPSYFSLPQAASAIRENQEVWVYHYGLNKEGKNVLSVSRGNVTQAAVGSGIMFRHTAPTRPGSSGGLVITRRGLFIGMTVGGNLQDGRENYALHACLVQNTRFKGIQLYAANLPSAISKLQTHGRYETVRKLLLAFEKKSGTKSPLVANTESQSSDIVKAIKMVASELVLNYGLAGMVVNSAAGDVFEFISDWNRQFNVHYTPYVLNGLSQSEVEKYKARGNTVVGKKKLLEYLKAASDSVYGAAKILEWCGSENVTVKIVSGIHKGGLGSATRAPDPVDHITIRTKWDEGVMTYHIRMKQEADGQWKISEITPRKF